MRVMRVWKKKVVVKKISNLILNDKNIGLAHMFHANRSPLLAVLVEDYDSLSENDLIGKIVNLLLFSDKHLE
jgi:hypothetical protein